MTNIKAIVTGAKISLEVSGPLTTGMVGVPVSFTFDEAWAGLTKTAVFRVGSQSINQVGIQTETTVPWEVLGKDGSILFLGVYGCNADGTVVIPTVWATVGRVQSGADPSGDESTDPSQPVWAQLAAENKQQAERIEQLAEDMENLEAGNVDLTDYPTKAEMGEAIEEAVNDIPIPEVDLTNYYTKAETDTEIAEALANIPTGGGGSGKWELVNTLTIDDPNTALLEISTDSDGNPLSLKKVRLRCAGFKPNATYAVMRINDLPWTQQFSSNGLGNTTMTESIPLVAILDVSDEQLYTSMYLRDRSYVGVTNIFVGEKTSYGGIMSKIETIRKIVLGLGTGASIVDGVLTVKVYGVRA